MDSRVTDFISSKEKWTQELIRLRTILLLLPLEETIKWGSPTYSYKGKNVVSIAAFKNHFGLWFFQGGLLKDKFKVLRNAQEGKTQAMRQMRLETAADIKEDIIKLYVLEAIDNIEAGKEIKPNRTTKPLLIPELLKEVFSKNEDIKIAFNEFTKSKQRDFADHISGAKREATKLSRLEKIIPMILRGEGLHDKYKNC
ncbi:YdeI family protein [Tenacibaculum sp. 1_MG-2023]|uniref:YdeI/OmpD-associated family protein n=1 Tax=Tenacibaculum sp. 1_MG-2023 TaxID=3062653 RepID=UPI0026E1207B|nr:DUF1801 domain-containing protein [Tenacibaculum sp. 1_MG-2023]MDO6599891.1 YdeI/OmpD-associated family protein [Tenacibaculum sp. 1_MG-2023]